MSEQTTKLNFIGRTFSQCVAEMCPGVVRLEYHGHDNGDETVTVRYGAGDTRRVDVTGLDLQESVEAILEALHGGTA